MAESLKKYQEDITVFITAVIALVIVYGYELTHFTMSVDEEFYDNYEQTVALGRWGHALIRKFILPEPYAPFFTTLLSIFFLALSVVVASKTLRLQTKESVVLALFFVAMPQFAYQMQFSNQSDTVSLGILCSCLATFFFICKPLKKSIFNHTCAFFLLVLSFSIYQSIVIIPLALIIASFLISFERIEVSHILKRISLLLFLIILSFIAYELISKLFPKSSDAGFNSYYSSQIRWISQGIYKCLDDVYISVKSFFDGKSPYALNYYMLALLSLPCILFSKVFRQKSLRIILALALLFLPFSFNLALGGYQPARVLVAMSFSFSLLALVVFRSFDKTKVMVGLGLILVLCSSANVSRMFYSDYMSQQADIALANKIMNDIHLLYPSYVDGVTPVYFFGGLYRKDAWFIDNAETFGVSFFTWGGGDNKRIRNFMAVNSIAKIKTESDINAIRSIFLEMKDAPSYPSVSAIKMVDGVMAVKLGAPWTAAP